RINKYDKTIVNIFIAEACNIFCIHANSIVREKTIQFLTLRPIYHKNDQSTIFPLPLGLLAYWLVNTLRSKLKAHGIHHSWKEIMRMGNTQKIITTTGYNAAGYEITVRKCSRPEEKLKKAHVRSFG